MAAMFVDGIIVALWLRICTVSNYNIDNPICRELIVVRYTRRGRNIIKRETTTVMMEARGEQPAKK